MPEKSEKSLNNTPAYVLRASDLADAYGVVIGVLSGGEVVSRLIGGDWG